MNTKNLTLFKEKLSAEKVELETQLAGISERNPSNPNEWDATSGGMDIDAADENEVADKMEELEENSGIAQKLEAQLNEVKAALERIEKGTYGVCEICGKEIAIQRLEANPSARNCREHAA
ncbi:MAG: TraR/DksA C4-type zinc finger protein [Patescibacteria group bacterium]|nr:TraR/DksA C4-type zinc finger protein [Patescibacteria group bacterium]